MRAHLARALSTWSLALLTLLSLGCIEPSSQGGDDRGGTPGCTGANCGPGGGLPAVTPGAPLSTKGNPDDGQSWTMLVYMIADNNLEGPAIIDMLEMAVAGGSADRFNLIVQIDRAEGYFGAHPDVPLPDFTSTKRFRITGQGFEELADLGETNTGDPRHLQDFLTWGIETYRADRTGLIMWDHGGGWSAFGGDDSHNHDILTMAEISQALSGALSSTGVERLAFLGFDACLMATYEVAQLMAPYAHFMMASQELEPGTGWDYRALRGVRERPSSTPEQLAADMLPAYKLQSEAGGQGGMVTLSLTDLNKLAALDAAIDRLAEEIDASGDYTALLRARTQVLAFNENPNPAASTNQVDPVDLARQLAAAQPRYASALAALEQAMAQAVISQVRAPTMRLATGLSLYLPHAAEHYRAEYGRLGLRSKWPALLNKLATGQIPTTTAPKFTNPNNIATFTDREDGSYAVYGILTPESMPSVTTATMYSAIIDRESNQYFVLQDIQGDLLPEHNAAVGVWKPEQYLYLSQGEAGSLVYMHLRVQGTSVVLTIPLAYQAVDSEETLDAFFLRVIDSQTGTISSEGFFASLGDGLVGELSPELGGTFYPSFLVIGDGQASWMADYDTAFDATLPINFAFTGLNAGVEVYLEVNAEDAAGNTDYVAYTTTL